MVATIVHVWVKPENLQEFIKATRENHLASVKESGNLRFDILIDSDNPNKFVLYEAYQTDEAAAAHKGTKHYLKWCETVASFMDQSRQGIKHNILFLQ